jgi:hypothetical protein
MACCSDGACPMHGGSSHESGSHDSVGQAQADACCAASERDTSNPSPQIFVAAISSAVLDVATILPISTPTLVLTDGWRTDAPVPVTPVPRHILLSVFLV